MKKLLFIPLLVSSLLLASCGQVPNSEHTHSFSTAWKYNSEKHWHECSCGEKNKEAYHSFGEWVIDKEATDTKDGSKHKTCSICEYTVNESIPATAEHTHSFSNTWEHDENKHWHECSCGEKSDEEEHTFGEWVIDKEATTTEEGSKHRTCSICDYEETETIPVIDEEHTHSFPKTWEHDEENHWHECSCGEKSDEAEHTFGEWVVDARATATEDGSKHKTCTVCEYTVTEVIPATGEEDRIEIEVGENDFCYVGENLADTIRYKMTLYYNGNPQDISNRSTGLSYEILDPSGKSFDITKPFDKAGTYQLKVTAKRGQLTISSDYVPITVKNSPTKELKTKSILPEGFNYYDFENSYGENLSFPTTGNINALVIPVEITDYPFKDVGYGDDYIPVIDKLFNGNGETDTGYWESVASFYKKSSMGQLNFTFDVAETYKPGYSSVDYLATGTGAAFTIASNALDNYKAVHGSDSTKKYDNDGDGYVDGLWIVYSAPQYAYQGQFMYPGYENYDVFWAFCSDFLGKLPDIDSPTFHSFGWASLWFAREKVDAPSIDAHTFIHETGHLLSLPDYYSYDYSGARASGAQGGLAMMDYNIGDQDSFSKIALGWANPYVPTEDCIVTIKPNESTGDCILLADSWNGTAFDEYILLDLQTPSGLNEMDATTQYDTYTPIYYSEPGIRMYHIDARLGEFKYNLVSENSSISQDGIYPIYFEGQDDCYLKDDYVKELVNKGSLSKLSHDTSVPLAERASGYTVINANSSSRTLIQSLPHTNNRLITLLGADNKLCEKDDVQGSNSSLFKKGDSWTINGRTARLFANGFNNGDTFSYVISVLECNSESATIQIRKINNNL